MPQQRHHRHNDRSGWNICPNCGTKCYSQSRFCSQCGSALGSSAPTPQQGMAGIPSPDTEIWEMRRQRQWLWQEQYRLESTLATEQAQFAQHQMALGLLGQQRQQLQQVERPKVIGGIILSGLLDLNHTLQEQNYTYQLRMLDQETMRCQFRLTQSMTRLQALMANLDRVRAEILRLDALLAP